MHEFSGSKKCMITLKNYALGPFVITSLPSARQLLFWTKSGLNTQMLQMHYPCCQCCLACLHQLRICPVRIVQNTVARNPEGPLSPAPGFTHNHPKSDHMFEIVVQMLLDLWQTWCHDHFPVDPCPVLNYSLSKELFPNV